MSDREPIARLNFFDLVLLLTRWKKTFIVNLAAVVLISVVVALTLPVWYSAKTVILPASAGGGLPSFLPKDLAGVASTFGFQTATDEIYQSILESRTLKQSIIDRFDLKKVYRLPSEAPPEDVLRVLEGLVEVSTREDLAIEIQVYDRSPQRAADIANAFVEELDYAYSRISAESARNNRVFIEKRLREINDSLRTLQDSLVVFQQTSNAISIPDQVQTMIKTVAEIKAEQLSTEVEIEMLKNSFGPNHPFVAQLATKRNELASKYDALLYGRESALFLDIQSLPGLTRQYADLMRKARIQNLLVEYMYPQYESAYIQERKETANVQVLDRAVVPVRKAKPPRKLIVLLSAVMGFVATLVYVLIREYFERLPQQNPEDYKKLNQIRSKVSHRRD